MFPQFYTGASGLVAAGKSLELTANNLANVRTPAYRPDRPLFASYLSAESSKGRPVAPGREPMSVSVAGGWRSDRPGPLRETGNPLDVALKGPGWLRVQTPEGERYTRAGSLTRGQDGTLSTQHGFAVLDDRGVPIRLPDGKVGIAPDGTLTVGDAVVARLGVADPGMANMDREGENLWRATGQVNQLTPEQTRIAQGFLEESGVEATRELMTMIETQRMFDMQQRIVNLTANTVVPGALKLGEP
jgi:flagellar basal body rod protein FlgG